MHYLSIHLFIIKSLSRLWECSRVIDHLVSSIVSHLLLLLSLLEIEPAISNTLGKHHNPSWCLSLNVPKKEKDWSTYRWVTLRVRYLNMTIQSWGVISYLLDISWNRNRKTYHIVTEEPTLYNGFFPHYIVWSASFLSFPVSLCLHSAAWGKLT